MRSLRKTHAWIVALLLAAGSSWADLPHPLDINLATEAQLDGVRGIGPALSRLILAHRQDKPFSGWTDLQQRVPGLGARKLKALSDAGLRVNGVDYPSGSPASKTTFPDQYRQ
jgi:competence protein ComEA